MNTKQRSNRGGISRGGYRKYNFSKSNQRHRKSGGENRRGSFSSGGRSSSTPNHRRKNSGGRGGFRGNGRKQPTFDPTMFIEANPVKAEAEVEIYTPQNTFNTFGLNQKLAQTVRDMGLITPTPIQDRIIPEIMKGNDVIGLAETGTGKTAAFLLPLIEKTLRDKTRQTLIMAPTRELAIQINEEFRKLSKGFSLFSTVCVGGINIKPQIRGLQKTNHFIIGTPGRLLDLLKRKSFDPRSLTTVVLDEADRMLDMGFINDMRKILSLTPSNRETLFFSATMPKEATRIVNDFLNNPVSISVKKTDTATSVSQDIVLYQQHNKYETLIKLLNAPDCSRVIIFGAMKHSVGKLAKELTQDGIKSESIHGNKSHVQRQRALGTFKRGDTKVLVATDVAARGIHVDGVSHVINYDLPSSFEDYIHRIGRTGRAAKRGTALTFVQQR